MKSWALLLLFQLVVFVPALAASWALAYWLYGPLRRLITWGTKLARRPPLALAVVGGLAGILAAAVSWVRPPVATIHDEFSYLLAADTFAHGRVTNRTHPLWEHFETFHVNQQPTYASKYPPAQGLILAVGKVVAHNPNLGLWLSSGLAAAVICWMLQGWMPGRWALLGGLLVALHPKIQFAWAQSYWGGNVALIGGGLLLGAYPRLVRLGRVRDALLMAFGVAILANSRPYEGLAASLPVAVALLAWLLRHRRFASRTVALRVLCPLGLVLLATAGMMAYYNARVTGQPNKLPYIAHEEIYNYTPMFLWGSSRPVPEYRHWVIRDFYRHWVEARIDLQRKLVGYVTIKGGDFLNAFVFLLGCSLAVPLVMTPWMLRSRGNWLALAVLLATSTALAGSAWIQPHYFAPAAGACFLLVVQDLRHLRVATGRRNRRGSVLVRALVLSHVLTWVVAGALHFSEPPTDPVAARASVLGRLEKMPGRHLVLVRYDRTHDSRHEWVYNEADIDGSKVVWARSMGTDSDRRLLEYFRSRRVWLLQADERPPRLMPLETPGSENP